MSGTGDCLGGGIRRDADLDAAPRCNPTEDAQGRTDRTPGVDRLLAAQVRAGCVEHYLGVMGRFAPVVCHVRLGGIVQDLRQGCFMALP